MTTPGGDGLRLLVLDAYPAEGREALAAHGASEAGLLYERMLHRLVPRARIDRLFPADPGASLPAGAALGDYHGMAWTGSSLTIHREGDERVRRQLELARAGFAAGVPAFGSCWAIQLAAVAAGGRCGPNPRGREFGVARKITLSDAGRAHAMFAGRPGAFDAFASHGDEVTGLPPGALLLASNRFTRVQALELQSGRGTFWAVQYHPEYDLHEVARLACVRAEELVAQGCFRDRPALDAWVEQLETLHREPERRDLAFALGLDEDVLEPALRELEVRHWLEDQVVLRAAGRA